MSETPRRAADPWNETTITAAEQAANRFLAGLTRLFIWGRRPA